MALEGLHHITAITADAPSNVDFYARLLGLRLIKKTVNFDAPDVYHLYYGSELAEPGSVLTFFEFPGVGRGRAGDGMVYRIVWRVGAEAALDFWAQRLTAEGYASERGEGTLRFTDFEGLEHELRVADVPDPPLAARASDIPAEHVLLGFDGVRAYASAPELSAELLRDALGFTGDGSEWRLAGAARRARLAYDEPPSAVGLQGAGSVHHVAWAAPDDEEELALRDRALTAGRHPTPVIDREYFHSVYFREPSGVLFELATLGPGFTVDEPLERLGTSLQLPPQHEHLRAQLERQLTPLHNPRESTPAGAA